jgi:hydrogenase nickel incorporation protein HypA/HybF
LDLAVNEATKHGATKVTSIKLKLGKLTQVVPDCVEFYIDLLAKDTIAAGAKLEIDWVPLVVECKNCGTKTELEQFNFSCLQCGQPTDVVSGRELYIDSIEVE